MAITKLDSKSLIYLPIVMSYWCSRYITFTFCGNIFDCVFSARHLTAATFRDCHHTGLSESSYCGIFDPGCTFPEKPGLGVQSLLWLIYKVSFPVPNRNQYRGIFLEKSFFSRHKKKVLRAVQSAIWLRINLTTRRSRYVGVRLEMSFPSGLLGGEAPAHVYHH